jgi:hypothetical protein
VNVIERLLQAPPLSWMVWLNQWLADRLIAPWLNPLLRPWELRQARGKVAYLSELRATLASVPSAQAHVDTAIASWVRRIEELKAT